MSIKGKCALVTGSTSGIGLGIARTLASQGAHIVLNGFGDAREIEALTEEIERDHDVRVLYSSADVTDVAQIEAMITRADQELGGVDILVNNAGIQFVDNIEEFPTEKWDAILAINLSSAFHTIRLTLDGMKQKGWGRVINIASAHGLVASPYKSAYVAAKHGLIGLTKVVALESATEGITCNAICPGYVLTPLVERQIPDTAREREISEEEVVRDVILAAQPTKQFVHLEEIGALVAFLCGDSACSITGSALTVDGGWTAQ